MNRRNFIETGLTAGVAAASTGIPQAKGKQTGRLTLPQPRKIAGELFGAGGYDAIWYLVNVGFVVRLGGRVHLPGPDSPERKSVV